MLIKELCSILCSLANYTLRLGGKQHSAKTNFLGNVKISCANFGWRFGQKISAFGRDTMLFGLKASLENCFYSVINVGQDAIYSSGFESVS